MRRTLLLLLLLWCSPLRGEIGHVIVKWSPQLCQASCNKQLHERFSTMKGVDKAEIDSGNGVMTLKWKKNAPFSYTDLSWTMKWIGLYMTYVRVNVSGQVVKSSNGYQLISKPDNTAFSLLGLAVPQNPNQAVTVYSAFSRPLSDQDREFLEQAVKNHLTITVDGPLFEPWRSPPLFLVMEQKKVGQPTNNKPAQR